MLFSEQSVISQKPLQPFMVGTLSCLLAPPTGLGDQGSWTGNSIAWEMPLQHGLPLLLMFSTLSSLLIWYKWRGWEPFGDEGLSLSPAEVHQDPVLLA